MQATEFLNPTDPRPYESISDLDRTHHLVITGIWDLPFGRGRRFGNSMPRAADFLLGGWQLNGVVQRQSGPPLGFGDVWTLFTGNPDDVKLSKDQRSPDHWFNVNAGFNKNSAQALASNIRVSPLRFSGIRGDGQARWDFSLIKSFVIHEDDADAVPGGVHQRVQSSESVRAEYDADELGVRDDHGAGRAAVVADVVDVEVLRGGEFDTEAQRHGEKTEEHGRLAGGLRDDGGGFRAGCGEVVCGALRFVPRGGGGGAGYGAAAGGDAADAVDVGGAGAVGDCAGAGGVGDAGVRTSGGRGIGRSGCICAVFECDGGGEWGGGGYGGGARVLLREGAVRGVSYGARLGEGGRAGFDERRAGVDARGTAAGAAQSGVAEDAGV